MELNRLRTLLAQKQVTARSLAERLDVNLSTVTKWSANANQPNVRTAKRICELLGIKSNELFTF